MQATKSLGITQKIVWIVLNVIVSVLKNLSKVFF